MKYHATSPIHSKGPWLFDEVTLDVSDADGNIVASVLLQERPDADDEPITRGNGKLIEIAPDLLRLARAAANAFRERISSLKSELLEEFCDHGDINDQIANYRHLLQEHEKVLSQWDSTD